MTTDECNFMKEFDYFLGKINYKESCLDARAIRFMNESRIMFFNELFVIYAKEACW